MLCTYEHTVFENQNNGYCVNQFSTEDESVPKLARSKQEGKRIFFTAVGYNLPTTNAINVLLDGQWKDSNYGLQLSVDTCSEVIPKTREGIISYLSSGLIKGIGQKTAKYIVDEYGLGALDVLDNSPEKLLGIKGINEAKLDKIISSYNQSKSVREIVSFLSPHGITLNKITKIRNTFGEDAYKIIKDDPFMLCTISGFGFKTVDNIARKIHCAPNSATRIRGAAFFALEEAENQGHLYLPSEECIQKIHKLLNEGFTNEVVSRQFVVDELRRMITQKLVYVSEKNVYLPNAILSEHKTAHSISRLLQSKVAYIADIQSEIAQSEKRLSITLSSAQRKAVQMCFNNTISIITGGPGTGKTTVLKVILDVFKQISEGEVLLAAPTGRAARRMSESTGISGATTLHAALSLTEEESDDYSADILHEDFIVIDEMSMVDMYLAEQLFTRLKKGAHILLVGDADQLPSVRAGNVFRELMKCGLIPVTVLDMVFRQTGNSRIAINAHKINANQTDLLFGDDFIFVPASDDAEAAKKIIDIYRKEVVNKGVDNVQILTSFRSRGGTSVNEMNTILREVINPNSSSKCEIKSGNKTFRTGDKVLQTKNSREISNGDVGFVSAVKLSEDEEESLVVEFSDDRISEYSKDDFDKLDLSYAVTIHKSQGSEYKTVIMPLLMSHYVMLRRNLVYTGITRAKEKLILVGQKKALFAAIHKNDIDARNTQLAKRIINFCEKHK